MTESRTFPFLDPDWRSVSTTALDVVTMSGEEGVGTGMVFLWWSSTKNNGGEKTMVTKV